MLPLLVTWGPGTNVTHYNHYPASSCLYSAKVRFWHVTELKLHIFGVFFKCYNVLQSTRKNHNKWGIYIVITCYCIPGEGGREGPPCYHYLLHGVRELMLPVTTVTRPPVACYMLQFCSTKVRFWHVTKLKLHIFGGNFQKNVTKCYKVPIKSVTSGVYIFRYYMLRLLRGVGGPLCYHYKALHRGV